MANKTCEKCGHLFTTPSQLQIHLKRKTPCDTQNKKFKCKYCNVLFSSSTSMYRHIRKSCNIFRLEEQKKIQEEQKKIEEKTDIQILQLQVQQLQMHIIQNNAILQPIQLHVQQPIQQIPITQTIIETAHVQNIENQQNIETQNNINVNIVQYNLPYNNTEDVLKTILTKGSAFNNYALVDEKDDLSIEDENDYLAKIIIEVQLEINTKSENCNVKSDKSQKGYTKVLTITDNIKKWCYISEDTIIREMADKTIKLINKSQYILPDKKVFQKLSTDLKQQISNTLERIPETYRENKDNIRDKTKPGFKNICDVNDSR